MKNKRILSFFLTIVLLFSLLMPQAYAASDILSGMKVKAKAALLVNLDTDTVLYQQDADKKIYPASITKVMTALLHCGHQDRRKAHRPGAAQLPAHCLRR